jgi:uncharacterized protein YecE (DUF72 family)
MAPTRYFIGTSGFHYKHWRERFYPKGLPTREWLAYYGARFDTVELNNSFYRLPSQAAVRGWREVTPAGFRFTVKVSRFITHVRQLRDIETPLATFLQRADHLEEKLGPLLYQLPPFMTRDDSLMEHFLASLPSDKQHVIEFRHASWFDDAVYRLLDALNVAFCVADHPKAPTPFVITGRRRLFSLPRQQWRVRRELQR